MGDEAVWDRYVLVATSAWVLPFAPVESSNVSVPTSPNGCQACVHDGEETGAATPTRLPPVPGGAWTAPMLAAVKRHEDLLREILRADHLGLAYVSRAADPNFRYSMQSRVDPLPFREFVGPAESGSFVDSVLGRFERHIVVPAEDWRHEEPFVLRHRIVMDRPRLEAVTGFRPPEATELRYFVTLDFRFVRSQRYQRWHLSIVVWSELPFSIEHRPPLRGQPGWRLREADESILTRDPLHYRNLFESIARRVERWLEGLGWEHSWLTISGRRYLHPDFWIAVPSKRPDPAYYSKDLFAPVAEFTRTMLRVDSMLDDALTVNVVNGDYLVIRRLANSIEDGYRKPSRVFRPARNPIYLVVVGDSRWLRPSQVFHVDEWGNPLPNRVDDSACPHHERCRRFEYVARQEFCMRDLIDALTDMETYAAFTLYEVYTDMQVWENHLTVYETTAAAGGRLWDSLATHLPIRRMRQLGRVHHAIELMHQTLLQGIADLNDLNALSRRCAAEVDAARQSLGERFDDVLVQRRADGAHSDDLRQMITETIISQIAVTADSLVKHADRVAEHYQELIDAVKDAFDERRVREGDALQKAGAVLALSLAFDSIVSIMSVVEPQAIGRQDTWLPVLAYSSGALVLLTSLAFIVWIMRLGRLGGRAFRTRYDGTRPKNLATLLGAIGAIVGIRSRRRDARKDGLWRFMKNSSTAALEGHLRRDPGTEFWRQLDDHLAADLAAVWDRQPGAPRPRRNTPSNPYAPIGRPDFVGYDIAALFSRVGDWSIEALLFTERPRRLDRYPLPKLTLLYRCIARLPSSFLRSEHFAAIAPNVVSEAEMNRVIRRYARAQGAPTRSSDNTELGRVIDLHLQSRNPGSAVEALAAIDQVLADHGLRTEQ